MKQGRYRNIDLQEVLHDDSYGIEGKYLISVYTEGAKLIVNNKPTSAGDIVIDYWKNIPNHFNFLELHEHFLTPDAFHGIVTIDLSGKKVGKKRVYFNVVSQFEIAFGMMVSRKNPFRVEGSIFHVISWFKAASLIEIVKFANPSFRWKSGYFDFTIKSEKEQKDLIKNLRSPVV